MTQSEDNLRRVILANAPALQPRMGWANAVAILGALAENESSFGVNTVPRYERVFDAGGIYASGTAAARKKWGALACCSYGSFQLLYISALELGYDPDRSPVDLWNDDVGIHWVIEFINRRILDRGVQTIMDFAITYNGGSVHANNDMVRAYANKFGLAYAGVVARRNLQGGADANVA